MSEWESLDAQAGFSSVVANPPYQLEISPASMQNEATVVPIFHEFQLVADQVSTRQSFIYPGERWVLQSGKGLATFGLAQINDPALQHLLFFSYSGTVFKDARMADGVTVVVKDQSCLQERFTLTHWARNDEIYSAKTEHPGSALLNLDPRVNEILAKIKPLLTPSVAFRKKAQKFFGIESNFVELNPERVTVEPLEGRVRLITNDRAGKAGRACTFYIEERHIPHNRAAVAKWKVISSSMNLTGINGRCPGGEILPPKTAVGRVKMVLGLFDTEEEATNYFRYLSSSIGRFLLASSGDTQSNFGLNLPDLHDYTAANESVDWAKTLDPQLAKLFHLSQDELAFVQEWVRTYLAGYSTRIFDEEAQAWKTVGFQRAIVQNRSH